ncbi:MAG: DUF5615 family PIN-like protein [Rubrobacter sp.]|jgi:predicted nuclease of predicted toxin-antitoxin system|nr:DUF5615 family PIN-like protein [Rubrobacter sp.]
MDHNVSRAITNGLRARSVDVLTAYEDGASELEDPALLDRATELQRILFTQDDDFLAETANRQQSEEPFSGVIYAHQLRVSVGDCIRDLELIAEVYEPHELAGQAMFLPL